MATLTPNLLLTKPAFNEYFDSWDDVANTNYDLIDAAVGTLQTLTLGAAGTASPATIAQRFSDVETDVAAVKSVTEVAAGYTEGTPAAGTFVGPDDVSLGMGAAGKMFHSFGLQLAELTGVSATLDATGGLATRLGRVKQGILVEGNQDLLVAGTANNHIKVDVAVDFEILVNGEYAIIRSESPEQQLAAAGAANGARYYLVAESVVWSDLAPPGGDGSSSGSTFTGTFAEGADSARPGDILDITAAPTNELLGQYVISTIGPGNTLTINGAFPSNLTPCTFQFRRRHWPTLALKKWGVEIDTILDGQAYLGAATPANRKGTVLGHASMTAIAPVFNMTSDPAVQYSPGLSYDSGWVIGSAFFDTPSTGLAGAVVQTKTISLPTIPTSHTLFWSKSASGAEAMRVPQQEITDTNGIRQWWTHNELSVVNPTGAETMQDVDGVLVNQAAANLGYFRLIAKG